MNFKKGLIICLAAPTGGGESTVTKKLIKKIPNATRIITYTSRPKRLKEKHGIDYYFIAKKTFLKNIKEGKFLEYTKVPNRDVYYGTKKFDFNNLLNQGKIIFFNCDAVGTKAVKKHYPKNGLSIFLAYEKISDIKKRLLKRQPDISREELNKRLQNAKREMKDKKYYDYVVINRQNQLDKTVARIYKIIIHKLTN